MRPRRSQTLVALLAASGVALVAGCGAAATSETTVNPAAQGSTAVVVPAPQSTVAVPAGVYESWADYEKHPVAAQGKVVLFFHAGWCSTCQEAERNLTSAPVPSGLTIVKVDYDNSNELRQKYGVTFQHTFVQVDASGTQLAKWSGSNDATAILGKTV